MTNFSLGDSQLKEVVKAALVEVLLEQREVFVEVLTEVMEEVGLARAIDAGRNTQVVGRDAIFKILGSSI
jgi:hypothetical protein